MRIVKGCIVAALALTAGAWAEVARADEAYICEAGRVVYVKPGELEIKKLQDPCIAKYFENTPTVARAAATGTTVRQGPAAVAMPAPVPQALSSAVAFRNVRIINASPASDVGLMNRH